jgi:hypothetical protein
MNKTTKRWLLVIGATLAVLALLIAASIVGSVVTETKTATLDEQGNPIAGPTVFISEAPER